MILFVPIITETANPIRLPKYNGLRMPLQDYMLWEPEDDSFLYEWNEGFLEAKEPMKLSEVSIFQNLNRKFALTKAYQEGWELINEVEYFLPTANRVRIPDISLLSPEQVKLSKNKSSIIIPFWVVEILSPSNASEQMESKMRDYFQAGVSFVWHIYPNLKEVRVYSSPKKVEILTEEDECTIGELFPDFKFQVKFLFN